MLKKIILAFAAAAALAWPGQAAAEIFPTTTELVVRVGEPFSVTFSTTVVGPWSAIYSYGTLPPGVDSSRQAGDPPSLDPITISGTPTSPGDSLIYVFVTDEGREVESRFFALTVIDLPPAPAPVGCTAPEGKRFVFRHRGGLLPC